MRRFAELERIGLGAAIAILLYHLIQGTTWVSPDWTAASIGVAVVALLNDLLDRRR